MLTDSEASAKKLQIQYPTDLLTVSAEPNDIDSILKVFIKITMLLKFKDNPVYCRFCQYF